MFTSTVRMVLWLWKKERILLEGCAGQTSKINSIHWFICLFQVPVGDDIYHYIATQVLNDFFLLDPVFFQTMTKLIQD